MQATGKLTLPGLQADGKAWPEGYSAKPSRCGLPVNSANWPPREEGGGGAEVNWMIMFMIWKTNVSFMTEFYVLVMIFLPRKLHHSVFAKFVQKISIKQSFQLGQKCSISNAKSTESDAANYSTRDWQ